MRGLSERDRRVVVVCAGAAAVAVVVGVLWGQSFYYATTGLGVPVSVVLELALRVGVLVVPALAGLVATVLTRIPLVGFAIALTAGVLGSLIGIVVFLGRGGVGLGVVDMVDLVLAPALYQLSLLAPEPLLRRGTAFTAATGALAGLLVGVARAVLSLGSQLFLQSPGSDRLGDLPLLYWVDALLLPAVLLVLGGAVAGQCASGAGPGGAPGAHTTRPGTPPAA